MCGIAGVWNRNGEPASASVLRRMVATIAHRGPDADGVFIDGALGLGAARLSVIDLDQRANQPFVTDDGSGVLVYNGELYGAAELRAELERFVEFRTDCDTEVVLHAVRTWGVVETVQRLDGIFAFGYFDRTARTLWLARDRWGIKPLYVSRLGSQLVFGSEVKALLAHPGVAREPNLLAVVSGLVLDNLEEPWTVFAGVEAVPRGCVWAIRDAVDVTEVRYWDALDALDLDRLVSNRQRTDDAVAELDTTLRTAVERQLVSDAPVAVLCSGGIDSGLLAAYAAARPTGIAATRPTDIAAAGPTGIGGYVADVVGAKPEAKRARRVGDALGLAITEVRVTEDDYLRCWPKAVWHQDYPICVASDPAFLAVTSACRRDGVKVALTGEGADELFCGYPWQLQAYGAWKWWSIQHRLGLGKRLGALGRMLTLSSDERGLRAHTFGNFEQPDPFQDLREACALHGGLKAQRHREILRRLDGIGSAAQRGLLAASLNSMYGHLGALLVRADRMGMAASVEVRVPYLSNAVVDLALHLPVPAKYHRGFGRHGLLGRRGSGKYVVRRLAARYLPADVVRAPKWGFSVNRKPYRYAAPLIRDGVARELLGWSQATTDHLLEELLGATKPIVLHLLAGVELWGRIFLRGESPAELGEFLVAQRRAAGSDPAPAAVGSQR